MKGMAAKNCFLKYLIIACISGMCIVAVFSIGKARVAKMEFGEGIKLAADPAGIRVMNDLAQAFSRKYPDIKINLETIEDASVAYHMLTTNQKDAVIAYHHSKARLLSEETSFIVIGRDNLSAIVNPKNPLSNISVKQLGDIFLGNVTNWKEIGGQNSAIKPVALGENHALTLFLAKEIGMDNIKYAGNVVIVKSYRELIDAVSADSGAVGFMLERGILDDNKVKVLTLKDEEPFEEEWCLFFRTRGQTPGLKLFVEYAKSPEAEAVFGKYFKQVN